MRFEIEAIFKITGRGYFVGAKCLEMQWDFQVTEYSKLGNFLIKAFLIQPRSLDKNGQLRLNIFCFQLQNSTDFDKLRVGEIVNLTNE